jgi:RNA polymerase sigma factor (sigma-70 family)
VHRELDDALAKLPYRRRAALALRYFCDLPDSEIAVALDVRPATVRSLIHRGLADLRKEITP